MNLYEIDRAIEEIYETAIDPETGEISEEAFEALNSLTMQRDTKIENVALWHKNCLAESRAIADEVRTLQERKRHIENKMAWMDRYLEYALNGQKFETPRVSISYRRSQAVELSDPDLFVLNYRDNADLVKTEYTPNKTEIKRMLKDGQKLVGATLVDRQNMQIK